MRKLVIAIALLGVFVWGLIKFISPSNPFDKMEAGVSQTTGPLSREQAQAKCPIALPEGATNIQYAVWSLWKASQTFVRFEAPTSVCLQHANEIMQKYSSGSAQVVTQTNIIGPQAMPMLISPSALNLIWFDLPRFTAGMAFQLNGAPTVWVDTNRGVFHFAVNE